MAAILPSFPRCCVRPVAGQDSSAGGPLHLEARYNYESIGARSAFVGWKFSGGDAVTWELTPLLGGYWFNPGTNEQVFINSIGTTF